MKTVFELDFDGFQVDSLYPKVLPDLYKDSEVVLFGRYRQYLHLENRWFPPYHFGDRIGVAGDFHGLVEDPKKIFCRLSCFQGIQQF